MQHEPRGCLVRLVGAHVNQDVTRLTLSYHVPRDQYLVFRTGTGFSSYDLHSHQWQRFPVTTRCSTVDLVVSPDAIIELAADDYSLVHFKVWPLAATFPRTCLKTRPQEFYRPCGSVYHLRFVTRSPGTAVAPTLVSNRSTGELHHADARDGRLSPPTTPALVDKAMHGATNTAIVGTTVHILCQNTRYEWNLHRFFVGPPTSHQVTSIPLCPQAGSWNVRTCVHANHFYVLTYHTLVRIGGVGCEAPETFEVPGVGWGGSELHLVSSPNFMYVVQCGQDTIARFDASTDQWTLLPCEWALSSFAAVVVV